MPCLCPTQIQARYQYGPASLPKVICEPEPEQTNQINKQICKYKTENGAGDIAQGPVAWMEASLEKQQNNTTKNSTTNSSHVIMVQMKTLT